MSLCLAGRSAALLQMGRVAEAGDDARRSMDVARQSGFPGLQALAPDLPRHGRLAGRRPGRRSPARAPGAGYPGRLRRRAAPGPQPVRDDDPDRGRRPGRRRAGLRGRAGLVPGSGRPGEPERPAVEQGDPGPAGQPHRRRDGASARTAPDRHADRAAACRPDRPGLLRPPVRGHPAPGRGDHGVGGGVRAQRSLAASVRHQEPGRAGGTPADMPGNSSGRPGPGRPGNAARP